MNRLFLSLAGISALNGTPIFDENAIQDQKTSNLEGLIRVAANLHDTAQPQLVAHDDLDGTPTGTIVMTVPGDWDEASAARLHELNVKYALQRITPEEDAERMELQSLQRRDIPTRSYREIIADATREMRERELVEALERYVRDVQHQPA